MDKPAVGENRPAAAKPSVPAQPADTTKDVDTEEKFKDDVDSAYSEIRRLMSERKNASGSPIKGLSPEDKEKADKAEKAERLRMADAIDARLRAKGLWDTDAGRQSMGMSSYLREDYDGAVAQFTKSIAAQSDPAVKRLITVDRGETYLAKGDKVNALNDLETAMKIKAANTESNLAELALKLGRIDDARRETERAAANKRLQTPGFVANWGVCHDLEVLGNPAAGCVTRAISACTRLYGTAEFGKDCAEYEAEAKYLKASGYPCPNGACKSKVKVSEQSSLK